MLNVTNKNCPKNIIVQKYVTVFFFVSVILSLFALILNRPNLMTVRVTRDVKTLRLS